MERIRWKARVQEKGTRLRDADPSIRTVFEDRLEKPKEYLDVFAISIFARYQVKQHLDTSIILKLS